MVRTMHQCINGEDTIFGIYFKVKQGNTLSPILFDIFFDDVEEIFDDSCYP